MLVIDDNGPAQRITCAHARSWGMEPVGVSSPDAAVGLLTAAQQFDVGVLDFDIPGWTCASAIRAIRSTSAGSTLPLLVLSSVTAARAELDQLPAERVRLHQKPVKAAALGDALRGVITGERAAPQRRRALLDPTTAARHPLRILVVDDSATNRLVMEKMLGRLGYRPEAVDSGRAATERMTAAYFDLVFMDVQMPGLDGLEVTRRIRSSQIAVGSIVGLSAHASDEARRQSLDAGMDEYVTKPLTAERLTAVIDGITRR
jgi:CheY-like chemotaxis protein